MKITEGRRIAEYIKDLIPSVFGGIMAGIVLLTFGKDYYFAATALLVIVLVGIAGYFAIRSYKPI